MRKFTKRIALAACTLFASSFAFNTASAQILWSEDFQGTGGAFPAGWAVFNVDGLTPATAVAYVTDAWIVRDDFIAPMMAGDSSAFSTSWYTPAGTANDWMISPGVALTTNCRLNWRALAPDPSYPDGYEVWAGTTQSVAGMTMKLLTVPAEINSWTNRYVDLDSAGLTSGTYYFAFRNMNTDMFLLLVDDIEVESLLPEDAEVISTDLPDDEYTIIPQTQVRPLNIGGTVRNNGSSSLSSVVLTCNIYDGALSLVNTVSSSPVATLAPAASSAVTMAAWTPPAMVPDFYLFEYIVSHSTADGNTANDTMYTGMLIADSTYARDDGNVTGGLGIGAGEGGYIGQDFTLLNDDFLTTVDVFYLRGYTGEPHALAIWDMSGGLPNTMIATTETLTYATDSSLLVTYNLSSGPIFLAAGTYAFTAIEFDSTVSVGQTADIFTLGTTWVNWPSAPAGTWDNFESFGTSFERANVIRPNLQDSAFVGVSNPVVNSGKLNAFPNPSNGKITLDVSMNNAGSAAIEIFDLHGKVVFTASESTSTFRRDLDLGNLAPGSYFVKVKSGEAVRVTKIVIQ